MSKYQPRDEFKDFHARRSRWSTIVAHRRCGKTVAVVSDIIEKATYNVRHAPRYAYVAPFLKQAKDIAWQYLKDYSAPYAPKINESGLFVELHALPNSPRITIYGADNPDSFRGLYLDGVALDEFGSMRGSIFEEILLPALIDRRGWAVFMGTPNGPNHFRDMWYKRVKDPTWFTSLLPVSKTKRIPEEDLEMMREMMDPEQYAQEMECSFEASVRGAIYARQVEQMLAEGRVDSQWAAQRGLPVHMVMDLGWADMTTLGFFQERPDGIVIDRAMGWNMKPIAHAIDEINKYFRDTRHVRGKLWLPHDARAKSLQTGKSIENMFTEAKMQPRIVPELSIQDGIAAVRQLFPSLHMNLPHTEDLVLAAKTYHRKYDEEKKVFTDEPVHDWSSHWMDMVRYMAIVAKKRSYATMKSSTELTYQFSLNDIWDCGPRRSARL